METILAHKTASLTEFRDPAKVIREAGGEIVAIMNRSNVMGYFVPKEKAGKQKFEYANHQEVLDILDASRDEHKEIIEYLKDK